MLEPLVNVMLWPLLFQMFTSWMYIFRGKAEQNVAALEPARKPPVWFW